MGIGQLDAAFRHPGSGIRMKLFGTEKIRKDRDDLRVELRSGKLFESRELLLVQAVLNRAIRVLCIEATPATGLVVVSVVGPARDGRKSVYATFTQLLGVLRRRIDGIDTVFDPLLCRI